MSTNEQPQGSEGGEKKFSKVRYVAARTVLYTAAVVTAPIWGTGLLAQKVLFKVTGKEEPVGWDGAFLSIAFMMWPLWPLWGISFLIDKVRDKYDDFKARN